MARYRILVVDDDEDTQFILKKILEGHYEVVMANNGLDALDSLDSVQPDIILTDNMMPVMDGWEFVKRVRKNPTFSNTTIIYLSALTQNKDIKAGYETGANMFLTKPIDPDRPLRMIGVLEKERQIPPRKKKYLLEDLGEEPSAPPPEPAIVAKQAPEATAKAEEKPKKKVELEVPRVLIVDDDEDLLRLLEIQLSSEFEIVTAKNGLEAMDQALEWKPDIFVVDWMMPKVTGTQMVDILRRTREFRNSPIIFMSAKSSPKERGMIEKLGVTAFLAKPFQPDQLSKAVHRITDSPNFRAKTDRPLLIGSKHLVRRHAELDPSGKKGREEGDLSWEG